VAASLFNAFQDARDVAFRRMMFTDALRYMLPWLTSEIDEIGEIFGGDPWPYGFEENRITLEAAVECLFDQGMIDRRVSIEELFLQPERPELES
jgi:4,5-dihydroxyphthalate decarboxylase